MNCFVEVRREGLYGIRVHFPIHNSRRQRCELTMNFRRETKHKLIWTIQSSSVQARVQIAGVCDLTGEVIEKVCFQMQNVILAGHQ